MKIKFRLILLVFLVSGSFLSGCATSPQDVEPKPFNPALYSGLTCQELASKKASLEQDKKNLYTEVKNQKTVSIICQVLSTSHVPTLPLIPFCPMIFQGEKGLTKLGFLKGKINAIDSKLAGCGDKQKIQINNNIKIVNRRNPSNNSALAKDNCGKKGDVCARLGWLEKKKGNLLDAKKLYKMACDSGHKQACEGLKKFK